MTRIRRSRPQRRFIGTRRESRQASRLLRTSGIAIFIGVVVAIVFYLSPMPNTQTPGKPLPGVSASLSGASLVGRASVIDGDTIEIRGERIRFNGIDAPESDQLCDDENATRYRCGAASAKYLETFLAVARPTRCEFVERDQYGRFVGNCFRSDGVSIAETMVREGQALDWRRYSGGAYAAVQAIAKANRSGVWRGTFQAPWEYREKKREKPSEPIAPLIAAPAAGDCPIKGNISSKGERIYHVPGQKFYNQTKISSAKGERWFCSEDQARSEGWRRARQ